MSTETPVEETSGRQDARPSQEAKWVFGLTSGAVALFVAFGAAENLRPEASGRISQDTVLPVSIAPIGELESPPTEFRWTPGGEDVDFSQIVLFDDRLQRIWASPLLREPRLTVDPQQLFRGVVAGRKCGWTVREVYQGRPRATSAIAEFSFATDVKGRGVGESIADAPLIEDAF